MSYLDELSSGLDGVYSAGSVPAIFTDRDGAEVCANVLFSTDLASFGDTAQVSGKTGVVTVRTSEISLLPLRDETFTISGRVYTVDEALRSDDLEHQVLVA